MCVSSEFHVPSLSKKSIWDGCGSPLCLLVILAPCPTHSITAATWSLSGPFSSAFCPAVFRAFVVQILPKSLIKVFFTFPILPSPRFLKFLYSLYFCPRTAISLLSSWLSCKTSLSVVNSQAALLLSCSLPLLFCCCKSNRLQVHTDRPG